MSVNKNYITLSYERDNLFDTTALVNLRDRYFVKGESSPQEAFARACAAFADSKEHAQRLYDYVSKHWFGFSTPMLANGGANNGTLPISCFLSPIPDSLNGITDHYKEIVHLTAKGGGVSGDWSKLRAGGKSNGMIPFLKVMDTLMLACSQSKTRRGSYAAYLDISHPDIEEFIDIRNPSGDVNRRCLGIGFHHGINITDEFMEAVEKGLPFQLVDPHSKEVTKTVEARDLWKAIINKRRKLGEPYLMFIDTANRALAQHLQDKGLRINQSNLCNEIYLPTGPDYAGMIRTAICCLSSVNAAKFNSWKPVAEQFIEDIIRMMDNALQYFIDNAPPEAAQAVYSAKMTRDLGLGVMGFHSYLQQEGIPFESKAALDVTNELFAILAMESSKASTKLGDEKGYYPDAYDADGVLQDRSRNAHKLALAPNASSSIILGNTSASCELISANAVKQGTLSGSFLQKNRQLEALLESKNLNTDEVWKSIFAHEGSVQQLDILSDDEKLVYKTAFEVDQSWVIEHAAIRAMYIDQGQSVNLFFDNKAKIKEIHDVHMSAWKKGLKGLYYQRGKAISTAEKLTVVRAKEQVAPDEGCVFCE
jgi:ribonucleoside-diphosphate reductase alpha chain